MINEFKGKYRFLSNFYPCIIIVSERLEDGTYKWFEYPSTEHAFQAAKCHNDEFKELISTVSAGEAKRLGKICKLRPDWEEIKDNVMHRVVFKKFLFHKNLREQLLATGEQELIEGNTWNDTYWGVCNGVGLNKLGHTLMKIREQLRNHNEG